MNTIFDPKLITREEFENIILSNMESLDDNCASEKGAGSFCRFVKYDNKEFALLTKRAENVVMATLKNVMSIINERSLPVAIVGAGMDIKEKGDYMIIMPKIEGINLPSYVYSMSKNITLASATSAISQEAINKLAEECCYLNSKSIAIDFHGGNFVWQEDKDVIRMLDLKKRGTASNVIVCKNVFKLMAVNQLQQFRNEEIVRKITEQQGIDINLITAKNIVKSYTALLKVNANEADVARGLKLVLGEKADIDKISGRIK